jgi:ferric-dicitrate binding protein FerR (iron transport regulator)
MAMSMDFKDFSEEDFINEAAFQDWVIAPDEAGDAFWLNFLTTYPEKKQTVENAKAFLKALAFRESWPSAEQVEHSLNRALDQITNEKRAGKKEPPRVRTLYRTMWAAAAVLLIAVCGLWFFNRYNKSEGSIDTVLSKKNDIAPGSNKAILTLADGSRVVLDTATNGAITHQGSVTVIKLNGQLSYNKDGVALNEVLFNTITTPRGGQYQLILADGSKVWLNAASSLKFPTAFTGKERKVELTGEGYFEVAHDVSKPFIVSKGETEIKVLGTHFNINAYDDEPSMKVTLLEGRVMVKKNTGLVYLNPGQQAILQPAQENIRISNDVDLDEVVAWKNGLFLFNNTPLENLMRQIERWYDVKVVYEGTKPQDTFGGGVSRNTNLSGVLKVLEYSNIRCKVDGNTITVLQPK